MSMMSFREEFFLFGWRCTGYFNNLERKLSLASPMSSSSSPKNISSKSGSSSDKFAISSIPAPSTDCYLPVSLTSEIGRVVLLDKPNISSSSVTKLGPERGRTPTTA
ncbi:hypothetical protein LguiB_017145 [Lonicera macranthoides]